MVFMYFTINVLFIQMMQHILEMHLIGDYILLVRSKPLTKITEPACIWSSFI